MYRSCEASRKSSKALIARVLRLTGVVRRLPAWLFSVGVMHSQEGSDKQSGRLGTNARGLRQECARGMGQGGERVDAR